ncbi:MAG: MerR family transcriptional regulator [Candidatus Binatia bacterium]
MKPLKIGEVAKQTGLSVKAIRFYEKIGLIPAPERIFSTGYRLYTERDVRRLRLIKRVKLLGLRLSQIEEIVKSMKGQGCDCNRIQPHLQKLVDEQLEEIDRKMRELMLLRTELKKIKKGTNKVPLPEGFCICSEIPVPLTRLGRALTL